MDYSQAGPSGVRIMTRKNIFDIMQQQEDLNFDQKLAFVENHLLSLENYSDKQIEEIKHRFSYIKSQMKCRWLAAHRKVESFLKYNRDWLDGTFELPRIIVKAGRPSKTFEESSERAKRRKTQELRTSTETECLIYATKMKLRSEGMRNASTVLDEITRSPQQATRYMKIYSSNLQETCTKLSPLKALAMFVEADLSRKQYEIVKQSNNKLYPCYSVLQRTKKDCYPKKESYYVNETCAQINLQDILDHTVTRLAAYLEDVLQLLSEEESNNLILICKWGCDGSQQSQFKQKFLNDSDSDANIFQSSFVPLQLNCGPYNKIIWQNPTPSSPRYCRPIRIRFIKETVDITIEEVNYIQDAINSLKKTQITSGDKNLSVAHKMLLTMVDAKVCNAISHNTSTMKCYICGETSKTFNNLKINTNVNQESLQFGLSILHARIRLFETLLHLSYKLPIQKWQLRLDTEKLIVAKRKLLIQKEFKSKMGLLVDVPKPGLGNTNDGNTSRRFFADPDLAAKITGLDRGLIYRIKVILQTISSGYKIDNEKFTQYTMDTAKLYVQLYPWYPMTPTMHKILLHGPIIISNALIPIGQLSEEAAEARNKHFRLYRQHRSRKFSREACNLDVLNRLLLTSDPLLSSIRPIPHKKSKPFLKETLEMLLSPEFEDKENVSSEEEVCSDEESWISSSSN